MIRTTAAAIIFLGISSLGPLARTAWAQNVTPGRALAEKRCATCHAIGATGKSPHKDALPFREIANRYPVESLAEAFAEGITVGHDDMPEFTLAPAEIDALLSYLSSLKQ